jgi:hypothetical protein
MSSIWLGSSFLGSTASLLELITVFQKDMTKNAMKKEKKKDGRGYERNDEELT